MILDKKACEKLGSEKAEIIGLLCAEGTHYEYISTWNAFFRIRGKYYTIIRNYESIEFTNLNHDLLEHFRKLMKSVYDYSPKPTGIKTSIKVRIRKKSIIKNLLKYSEFGSLKWHIPEQIWISDNKTKAAFIRGLFDGDANFRASRITFSSINKRGIESVSSLLLKMGLKSIIRGPYAGGGNAKPIYSLTISGSDVLKYKKLINSKHPKKRDVLKSLGKH